MEGTTVTFSYTGGGSGISPDTISGSLRPTTSPSTSQNYTVYAKKNGQTVSDAVQFHVTSTMKPITFTLTALSLYVGFDDSALAGNPDVYGEIKVKFFGLDYIETVNIEDISDDIEGISYNSKKTQPNDIFICLTGEHVDGHEYADEAFANGALVCVVERRLTIDMPQIVVASTQEAMAQISNMFYSEPSTKLNIIGVTGTNGKTTVTHLIQKLYEEMGQKCALIGTLGHKFTSIEDYRDVKHTTPQAPELQELLYDINEKCIDNVAMEVSSHSLVQHRVDYVDFNGAVLTNLTQDHLDFHITMENYFKAKAKISDAEAVP